MDFLLGFFNRDVQCLHELFAYGRVPEIAQQDQIKCGAWQSKSQWTDGHEQEF